MPRAPNETAEEPALSPDPPPPPPGLLLLWSGTDPTFVARPLHRPLKIGRSEDTDVCLGADRWVSSLHAEVFASLGSFVVRDLGSRHGTFVNGARVTEVSVEPGAVVRVGRTVMLLGPLPVGPATEIDGGYVVSAHQRRLRAAVSEAARLGIDLLILGDTGAGKEALARHYHACGPRARGPFVAWSAATFQPTTAEADLFGSRRGGFTGAVDREGLLAQADGGTLYLDELGELPLAVQSKLLRALQEREIAAVGGGRARRVDFRLCAATSVDLDEAIAGGRFREDFLHRVRGATVRLAPLDERRDEIPFLLATSDKLKDANVALTAPFVEACMLRRWPGNVRELRNALSHAMIMACSDPQLSAPPGAPIELLPKHLPTHTRVSAPPPPSPPSAEEEERRRLADAFRRANGNGVEAAKSLGMARSTFYEKLDKYGLKRR
ncbi:MAG: sigma 54-interacting transcriptional regulator [Deltaproteobacteria bacterium]|nr:sigma 54-interacting transcriptional regulator [Deltaproteobacteria bacterium]